MGEHSPTHSAALGAIRAWLTNGRSASKVPTSPPTINRRSRRMLDIVLGYLAFFVFALFIIERHSHES